MIDGLDRNVVGGIAKPLIHAATDQSFLDAAAKHGFSVALPGQAWRNQLPFVDKRRQYLRDLGYLLHERLDPATDALSDGVLEEYAGSYVDAALARGVSRIRATTPCTATPRTTDSSSSTTTTRTVC